MQSKIFIRLLFMILFCWMSLYFVNNRLPNLLTFTDDAGNIKQVTNRSEWQIKRSQILDSMQDAMGNLPYRKSLSAVKFNYLDSLKTEYYTRYTIHINVYKGEIVPAYLYKPRKKIDENKYPAMVALHPTGTLGKRIVDGQSDLPRRAYANELAERGYVVIAPDYPGFGDMENYNFNSDRYQSGTMKALFDEMRCVDLLQALPEVDSSKIGVVGHSLGGHGAIFLGAFDTRIKAVISSSGWTLFDYYFNGDSVAAMKNGGRLWPWAQDRYMPLIKSKYHLNPEEIPFDFDEVIAAIAPRAFFSNSPLRDVNFNVAGVRAGIKNALKVYHFLNSVSSLKVYYPDSGHDFPDDERFQSYHFLDSLFDHSGKKYHYSFWDNNHYRGRLKIFSKIKGDRQIVMLGNSLTERGGDWGERLNRKAVLNLGIGSDITAGYLSRIGSVLNRNPKICFIEGGVNDLAQNISQDIILHHLSLLVDTLRAQNIVPVLATLTYVTPSYKAINPSVFNKEIESLNQKIKILADNEKILIIDLNKRLSKNGFLEKEYADEDGIHYSEVGFQIWGEEIRKILGKIDL